MAANKTTTHISEEEIYKQATERVKEKKDFYGHFTTYAAVNIILVSIWAFGSDGGYPWFLWPLGCWGIFGIIPNFLKTFVFPGGTGWERGQIEREAQKMRRAGY